ncbi:unnamed protein product [Phytophthora lilii]|uniref:Unnamed protein product n=1 Tax=Phytophthora lilii TaxID=2077276 RepID=A0A9W6X3P3_9STRA|nr:unnamed protein product [Phytophthora lilii]
MAKERSGKHLRKEKKTKQPKPELNWESTNGDSSADIEREARLIIVRKSGRHVRNTVSPGANTQLEEKRQRSIYQKRARWEKQDRIAKEKELELDRRRAENIAMKCEDTLAQVVEQDSRRKTRLRERKAKRDQQAMCAIFKCMHEMNGKRFLVAIFTRLARGYDLEGLRIVAYDPSSSASFSLVMTLHEFNCLGYGRTSDGLGAFCKWLCLLYEKRRRQFRLVWSGSPCPPPLRVRESDQTLVCIHKEGVKMRHAVAYNFSLVGLYLRTDNPTIVRFVMSSWHAQDCVLGEYALAAHSLILGSDLDLKWKSPEHAMIVWKHRADDIISEDIHSSHSINIATRSISELSARVYSSEVFVNRTRYLLHLYDSGQTQYTIELTPILKSSKQDTIPLRHPVNSSIIIFKREVNPYNIPLSSSNFAELISLIRFEQTFTPPEHEGRFENDSQVDRLQWKATISSKWARTLAKYVRVIRLAKYACKIGGIFCFVAIFVVQQKTKFRAHLLLELTWLSATQSSSCSVGGAVTRQSLRIALSDYLRCGNALSRLTFGLGYGDSMNEHECSACWMYAAARARLYENENVLDKMPFGDSSSCFNCVSIQYRRLKAIKELLAHAGHIPPQSLEFVYHGYCEGCAMLVSPIVLVVGSMVSITYTWLQPLLERYFASYDCTNDGFLHFIEEEQHHAIEQDSIQIREAVLQTLERDRVAVLFNADCGITVASANSFVHELHWWLFPDHSDLPCHVAFVVADQNYNADGINSFVQNTRAVHRDYDLLESLEALDNLVHQIAKLDPVHLDDGDEEERDRASAFDAYLVAEAVLVEAIRVLLHQDMSWQKPRKIVGASSWSTACNFLLNPAQLSTGLQAVNPLKVNVAAAEVLEAYFAHAKWPHNYSDVRPFFYELLGYMLHIQHVRQILALRSGSLQNSQTRRIAIDDVTDTTHDSLAKNTSVIECSFTNTSQTVIGS